MEEDEGPRARKGGDEIRCAFAWCTREVDACPRGMDRRRRLAHEEMRQGERRSGTVHGSLPFLVMRLEGTRLEVTWPAHHALGRHCRAHTTWLGTLLERPRTPRTPRTPWPRSCQADVCWVQLYHAGVLLVRTMA